MTRRIPSSLIVFTLLVGCNRAATVESSPPAVSVAAAPSATAAVPSAAVAASGAAVAAAPSAEPASTLLAVGSEVPDVSAVAQDGKTVRLRALKGKPLVVYFYPKDDTTGCTIEAKGIRDQYQDLKSRALVFGVSSDNQDSH
ncbi:MAG TPA: peroxiredoxin, partial [Polyangiaceae bacterium]|nr:peroxiredoxin [Polyangiaceae bacterium]